MARPPSHTVIAVHGHRYLIGGDEPDPALVRAVDAAVAKALQADPLPPAAVVWDAQTPGGERAIAFGEGLDDLLLSQIDASGCCAILEDSWRKLGSRVSGLGEALALLARDPTVRVARAEGVHGRVALKGAAQPAPGLRPKLVSVILLLDGPADPFEPFLDALAEQKGVALEVLALAAGLGAEDTRTLGARLDARIGPGNLRLRPFILRGKMSRAMLANTGVSLASGEVAVIAASACRPRSETTLRNLAAWAMGAETL
ncbi:MAG: hypothetical protein ACXWVJ_02505, partial [Caulobacteraceae bacterium]